MILAAPAIVHTLARLAEPWKNVYSDSKTLETAVTFAHLGALLLGGGFAVAADRMTLRVPRDDVAARTRQLQDISAVHRPVLIALVILFLSGVAMAASDVESFLPSPVFWIKISLVVLLLANGGVLYTTEGALQTGRGDAAVLWGRLRMASVASLVLWTATTLAGVALMTFS
jgi:hypothetical protein